MDIEYSCVLRYQLFINEYQKVDISKCSHVRFVIMIKYEKPRNKNKIKQPN